jgi:hypothetical protein
MSPHSHLLPFHPFSTGRPKSSTRPPAEPQETPEPSYPLSFSLWSDADLAAERFTDSAAAKGKDKGRWPYEAPTNGALLPPSLRSECATWTRSADLARNEEGEWRIGM